MIILGRTVPAPPGSPRSRTSSPSRSTRRPTDGPGRARGREEGRPAGRRHGPDPGRRAGGDGLGRSDRRRWRPCDSGGAGPARRGRPARRIVLGRRGLKAIRETLDLTIILAMDEEGMQVATKARKKPRRAGKIFVAGYISHPNGSMAGVYGPNPPSSTTGPRSWAGSRSRRPWTAPGRRGRAARSRTRVRRGSDQGLGSHGRRDRRPSPRRHRYAISIVGSDRTIRKDRWNERRSPGTGHRSEIAGASVIGVSPDGPSTPDALGEHRLLVERPVGRRRASGGSRSRAPGGGGPPPRPRAPGRPRGWSAPGCWG